MEPGDFQTASDQADGRGVGAGEVRVADVGEQEEEFAQVFALVVRCLRELGVCEQWIEDAEVGVSKGGGVCCWAGRGW